MNITRSTLTMVLVIISLMTLVPSQMLQAQDAPQPPIEVPEGYTYINPKPGISAPGSRDNGGVSTNSVTGPRGYGDAYALYQGSNITGWAQTWLDSNISTTHNICAQMVTLDVNGLSWASQPAYNCKNTTGGTVNSNITSSATAYGVPCQSFVAVRTNHRIEQTGFSWEDDDLDGFSSFCG